MENQVILEMLNISKFFPGVKAIDDVSFNLRKGEVHCLLGENGAGKSTLIKILSGALIKDSGTILLKGKEVDIENALDSKKLGISTIYQEMNLVPCMNVVENMFLGDEVSHYFSLDLREMELKTQEVLKKIKVRLNIHSLIKELSVAQQQMVEIAKSLIYKKEIIIMDEPTSSLSENDTQELFRIIRELKTQGVSIIYISHRLQELQQIVDRVTVLRDGKSVNTVDINDVELADLIEMMVGRTLEDVVKPSNKEFGEKVLEVRNIKTHEKLKDISFKLNKGEILGFAGLIGSGRTELMKIIFGADRAEAGEIIIKGKTMKNFNTQNTVKEGVSYLSENRASEGLVLGMSISHNITLASLASVSKRFLLQLKKEKFTVTNMVDKLKISTTSIDKQAKYLSGGNQQKVVVGKWLVTNSDILIFDEPTRGIDVGTKAEIYHIINNLSNEGKSIIVVSSDLPEILRICNRIVVICNGMVTGDISNNENTTQQEIMNLMLGEVKNA